MSARTGPAPPGASDQMNAIDDFGADIATLRSRLRQQRLVASFGSEALGAADFDGLLQEAARVAAEGLGTDFAKVLEYLPREDALLIRAGIGWGSGVVGVVKLGADTASPAGFALKTGQPVISNHLAEEQRFRTPQVMAEHGVRRAVNVIVRGKREGRPFGVLEVDTRDATESFSPDDIAFLQALANTLGLAVDRERDHADRDLLVREVDHRVKNSLQIVLSMLRVQANDPDAGAARPQLEEAARRVQTIAAVHERLCFGAEIGQVVITDYLDALAEDIRLSSGLEAMGRSLCLEVAPSQTRALWDADRATTLGLVATELLTNAIKHASGDIVLRLEPGDDITPATLVVENEGAGPAPDFDPEFSKGLGMRLLTSLLRGGGLELQRGADWTRFVATFPAPEGSD